MNKKLTMLLVYPDFLEEDKYNKSKLGNYSEGLASISAVLKQAEYNVRLEHMLYMPTKKEFVERVKAHNPDVIGFTMRTTAMPFVRELAGWLDDDDSGLSDIPVTVGGYHPTLVPEECLAVRGIDMVTIGEGEYPLLEYMDSLRDGTNRTDIQSTWFKQADGTIIKNDVRPLIEDLDTLPFPDFELFDFANLDRSKNFTAMVML
ncbi:MAG: cobalamin-dependent protein, partial [Oscillospiraceae bacterium]|nr:cobalamin-dependent protein [Oscillospiraceae bacterium]